MNIQVCKIHPRALLPEKKSSQAAAWDLHALEDTWIRRMPSLVRTGLVVRPPPGFHTELLIRSSLAMKGIVICNSIGLIDADYCGPEDEVCFLFRTMMETYEPFRIQQGMRIGQMLLRKTHLADIVKIDSPQQDSSRGGFGSTGE